MKNTFVLLDELYKGKWIVKFAFNAENEDTARKMACKWARYHGMCKSEVDVREATENEANNLLHNEHIDFVNELKTI